MPKREVAVLRPFYKKEGETFYEIVSVDESRLGDDDELLIERGGAGSGHHGHSGRPGEVGGSLPKGVREGGGEYSPNTLLKMTLGGKIHCGYGDTLDPLCGVRSPLRTPGRNAARELGPVDNTRDVTCKNCNKKAVKKFKSMEADLIAKIGDDERELDNFVDYVVTWHYGDRSGEVAEKLWKEARSNWIENWRYENKDMSQEEGYEYLDSLNKHERYKVYDDLIIMNYAILEGQNTEETISHLRIHFPRAFEKVLSRWTREQMVERGGPGSGHHGHAGRPGERGGSLPKGYGLGDKLHVPRTARWDYVREGFDLIKQVHTLPEDAIADIPLQEARGKNRVGGYMYSSEEAIKMLIGLKDQDGWAHSTLATTVHESAHFMDHTMLSWNDQFSVNPLSWVSKQAGALYDVWESPSNAAAKLEDMGVEYETARAMIDWYDAVRHSEGFEELEAYTGGYKNIELPIGYFKGPRDNPTNVIKSPGQIGEYDIPFQVVRNYRKPEELWARSYVQYIASRSGNEELYRTIRESQMMADSGMIPAYWEDDDFEPIAEAMDEVFRSKGWLNE